MKDHQNPMAASEGEIRRMTGDLDALHHDVGMPAMRASLAEWREHLRSGSTKPTSRRAFLLGSGGIIGAGALAAACSTSSSSSTRTSATGASNSASSQSQLSGDLAVAALAASLENLAVYAYGAAISAAKAGKLGTVPPAISQFAVTVRTQHTQHAAAWNAILTAAGKKRVTVTDPKLTPTVNQKFAQVTNVTELGQLALLLENIAAQTYQAEASKLRSSRAVAVASTIQPVEMQHAAILYYVLGEYPGIQSSSGPLAFNPTTQAA
ncbi:MAG: ferritin-like domain-containing protein [Acidimicrobiales bacterium]